MFSFTPVSATMMHNEKTIITGLTEKKSSVVFYKRGILKNFIKFTGKHLCWSLFLIKLQRAIIFFLGA